MAGAVCPSCGVAVTPGYVRCPKCRKPLPRSRASSPVVGGTAVESTSKGPLVAIIAIAIVGIGLIAWLGLRGGDAKKPAPVATPTATPQEATPTEVEAPTPDQPTNTGPAQPAAPDPGAVTARLERALKKERLWSTVSFDGNRVEVRSGSCSDPKLAGILDASTPSLKAAGLTRLRCLEQSGQVVTDRDL